MGFFCEPGHELAGRGRKDLGFAVVTEVRRRAMLSVDHTRRREVPRIAAGAAPAGAAIFEQIQRYNLCDAPFRLVTVTLRHGDLLEIPATNRATFEKNNAIPAGGSMTLYRETP